MRIAVCLFVLGLSACVAIPDSADEAAMRERREKPEVHADLVEAMLAQGQNHAALAHIEELERKRSGDPQQLRYLRAKTQYKLGDLAAAERNYRRLIDGDYAGEAWHGLGLIAARTDLRSAVLNFNRAVSVRPTDAGIRNDLGYTLMQAGRLTEARHHLATATELDPNGVQAQNNLVLSFLLDGQETRARGLADSFKLPASQWRQLRAESEIMRRLIAQRSAELMAQPENPPTQERNPDEKLDSNTQRRSLPGLYSGRR